MKRKFLRPNFNLKKLILVFALIHTIQPLIVEAQLSFQKTYGNTGTDTGQDITINQDGGYTIAGYTTSYGVGFSDIYIIRTKPNGDTLWTKVLGGRGLEEAWSIQQAGGGNYIIAGYTTSKGAGGMDFYLVKMDENGDTLWTKTYGGTGNEVAREIRVTKNGDYIVVGSIDGPESSSSDIYLIKTNSNGDTLWTRRYGGNGVEYGRSVKETQDGGYIIVGETTSYGAGAGDVYLIKTDVNGDTLWTKTFGGSGTEEGKNIQLTTEGGYIMIADYDVNGIGQSDLYIIKTDENGDTLWTKLYGGADKDVAKSIELANDGGYIIAGISRSFGLINPDIWIIKTNSMGDTLWSKFYGSYGHEHCYVVKQTSDKGYVAIGHTNLIPGNLEDVYLLKLDSIGNIDITSSINENAYYAGNISIYPNPSNGLFKIEYEQSDYSFTELSLLNATGRTVYHVRNTTGEHSKTIDVSGLAKGLYLLKINTEKQSIMKRVVLY